MIYYFFSTLRIDIRIFLYSKSSITMSQCNTLNIVYLVERLIIQKCVFWPRQVRQNTKTKNKSVLVCVLHKVLQINQIELTNNICFRKQHNQTNNVFACQYLPCAMKKATITTISCIYIVLSVKL